MGKFIWTCGINDKVAESAKFSKEVFNAIKRYNSHDWGDLCNEDKQMNDDAIISGDDRILAAYNTSEGKIYIITEWDLSVTTVLFADEY